MVIDRFVDPPAPDESGFLTSRTALVTGAARRIGRELALALAAEGAHVLVHHHESEAAARETVREIEAAGGSADRIAGDLAEAGVAAGLLARAADTCGNPVDILINNAAGFLRADLAVTSAEQWDRLQAVNLRAPFLLAQGFAAQLPAQWSGQIINLNDARALAGDPEHFAYGVTKAGLHGLTRTLAKALAPRIAVNELCLGAVLAPEGGDYVHTTRAELPLGRFPQLEDVIASMMYLLDSRSLTGQSLHLDGGQYL